MTTKRELFWNSLDQANLKLTILLSAEITGVPAMPCWFIFKDWDLEESLTLILILLDLAVSEVLLGSIFPLAPRCVSVECSALWVLACPSLLPFAQGISGSPCLMEEAGTAMVPALLLPHLGVPCNLGA